MKKRLTSATARRMTVSVFCAVLLFAVLTVLALVAPRGAKADEATTEPVPTVGAELYTAETADGAKTKVGDYDNIKLAVDAAVADNAERLSAESEPLFYTVDVLADCEIDITDTANRYSAGNLPNGIYTGSADALTGILIAGDIDLTINGGEHTVLLTDNKAETLRGMRVRGDSHVVINDLEIVTRAKAESKCLETREGNVKLELNRVIVQVSAFGNSQALCLGGAGYVGDKVTTTTCVATDCSFGTPVAGRKINGKEVKNYFDQDGDGVADDPNWRIPTSHYGINAFVKIDLTLDNSSSGGFAALYLKTPDSSTGTRNSVVRVNNGSYLRGYNVNSGDSNNFAAVVFERHFSNTTYYDYDNDGIIDGTANSSNQFTITDKSGEEIDVITHYNNTSNITVSVDNSTIESTTVNPNAPANQYCFSFQTFNNKLSVAGNSKLITDDEFRSAPTKAVLEHTYGSNDISIVGGRVFKWSELPVAYIDSDVAVGDMLYETLQQAIDSAESGDTVTLIRNIQAESGSAVAGSNYSAAAFVGGDKDITLDLNGKSLYLESDENALAAVVNNGDLTVKNGTIELSYDSAPNALIVNNGELILSGLYVIDRTDAHDGAMIVNGSAVSKSAGGASLTVESGTYVSVGSNVIENGIGATVTVLGGTLESRATSGTALVNAGTATIEGGTLKGTNAIVSDAETKIASGVFKGAIAFTTDDVSISGGTFDATAKAVVSQYISANYQLTDVGTTVVVTQFLARKDLVYSGNEYSFGTELNALLAANSVKITDDMTVTLSKYIDADGTESETLPEKVKNAGTYSFAIELADGTQTAIDIVIARKLVSLQNVDFTVVKIGDETVDLSFESMILYFDADGNFSYVKDATHTIAVEIMNGVVRNRDGESFTLGLAADDAYDAEISGETVTGAKKCTTTATLTVKDNFALYVADTDALLRRGIVITENSDGTFTLEKTWYLANIGKWLVNNKGNDYVIGAGHVFGQTPNIDIPWLSSGDMPGADQSPVFDDLIHLALSYNGNVVNADFRRYEFGNYINSSMPVGEYKFTVTVDEGITVIYDYEVYPATVNQTILDDFLNALNDTDGTDNYMSVEWDGYMHVFDESTAVKFETLKQAVANSVPERSGCWLGNEYDACYGDLVIEYNLDRMHNAQYYDQNTLAGLVVRPDAPGLYTVYYTLSAKNFAPFIDLDPDDADFDNARRMFVYYIAIIRGVDIPTVGSAVYTGVLLKGDIVGNAYYTVDAYDGFVDVDEYSIVLRLREPEYYYWVGHELGEATCEVTFEITKATNDWIEAPDVVRWIEGKFDADENTFIGAAKFGSIAYVITDVNDNVIFDLSQNIDNRASMKAGTYILKATVGGTKNYNGLSEAFTIRILEKIGLPWWGTLLIVIGALGVAALVIFILWKKEVFQILTEKIVVSIRTRASVDATIAAVRAAKKEDEAKKSIAAAEAKEKAEARRAAAKAEKEKPAEERAAALEAKAKAQAERAEKLRLRAEAMQERAKRLRDGDQPSQDADAEAAATSETTETTPSED